MSFEILNWYGNQFVILDSKPIKQKRSADLFSTEDHLILWGRKKKKNKSNVALWVGSSFIKTCAHDRFVWFIPRDHRVTLEGADAKKKVWVACMKLENRPTGEPRKVLLERNLFLSFSEKCVFGVLFLWRKTECSCRVCVRNRVIQRKTEQRRKQWMSVGS